MIFFANICSKPKQQASVAQSTYLGTAAMIFVDLKMIDCVRVSMAALLYRYHPEIITTESDDNRTYNISLMLRP